MLDIIRHLREIDPHAYVQVFANLQNRKEGYVQIKTRLVWSPQLPRAIQSALRIARVAVPAPEESIEVHEHRTQDALRKVQEHIASALDERFNKGRRRNKRSVEVRFSPFENEDRSAEMDLHGGRRLGKPIIGDWSPEELKKALLNARRNEGRAMVPQDEALEPVAIRRLLGGRRVSRLEPDGPDWKPTHDQLDKAGGRSVNEPVFGEFEIQVRAKINPKTWAVRERDLKKAGAKVTTQRPRAIKAARYERAPR